MRRGVGVEDGAVGEDELVVEDVVGAEAVLEGEEADSACKYVRKSWMRENKDAYRRGKTRQRRLQAYVRRQW